MEIKKKEKFNCYKCEYRGCVPGSAHSCCNHPLVKQEKEDNFLSMFAIFASVGRCPAIIAGAKKLNIKGHPQGIRNGWFNFPFNFDPTWLLNCDGFKQKESNK